jgi:hypothetical protein
MAVAHRSLSNTFMRFFESDILFKTYGNKTLGFCCLASDHHRPRTRTQKS